MAKRNKLVPMPQTRGVKDDLDAIERMLQAKYRLIAAGAPDFRWDAIRKIVRRCGAILTGAKKTDQLTPEDSIRLMNQAIEGVHELLNEVWDILENKDGAANVQKEVADLVKLKGEVQKRQAETYKLSGQYVEREELLTEMEEWKRVINDAIDVERDQRLASRLKNRIAKGLGKRRPGKPDPGLYDEDMGAADAGTVRGGDGELQDEVVAEDLVQGTGDAGPEEGDPAFDPRRSSDGKELAGEYAASGVASGDEPS